MNNDKVQLVLDRQSIRETLFRMAVYCDEANVSGLDEIWAPDSRRDSGAGRDEVNGLDAIKEQLTGMLSRYRWTHHHLGDSLIEVRGDEASAMTYVATWHELLNGERCWGTARYYDELRRAEDGRWLITFRRLILTGAEGTKTEKNAEWLERWVSTGKDADPTSA